MKHSSPHALRVLAALLTPLLAVAQAPEARTELEPLVVMGIRPLVKIAEHPLLEPRFGAAICAEDDYLYVIGGSNGEGTRLDSIERINLRTGHAERWAKLAIARRHHRAVILGRKLYVLGGTSGPVDPDDPLSEELSDYSGDDLPIGRLLPASLLAPPENQLKPPGFAQLKPAYTVEPTMEVVDLATGQVRAGSPMPVPKAMFGCVAVGGKILVIGGQKRRGEAVFCTNTTEVFDPAENKWSAGISMPTARRGTACVVDGFVMFLGGYGGTRAVRTVEVFNPHDKIWRLLPELSEAVNPSATVWTGNYIYLFGDQNHRTRQLVYDLRTKQLVPYPLALPDSDFAAALLHQRKIYVVGGASLRQHSATEAIQVFAPIADTSVSVPPAGK